MTKRPICLIIRDGWGHGKHDQDDMIHLADTKYTDEYESKYPNMLIRADGEYVGLPEGSQGNSEVGHMTIGSGRIIYQNLTRIDKEIKNGEFFENNVFLQAIERAKQKNSEIHLIGLIQEEGVHSVTRHANALLQLFKKHNFDNVNIHAITDGRDTPPKSAKEHLSLLRKGIEKTGVGRIVTVIGRYFAMDRDTRWDRTKIAYDAIVYGTGKEVSSWEEAIDDAYGSGENDEFIKPRLIDYQGVGKDDVLIFFNFRTDRTRQLTRAITDSAFSEFETLKHNIHFVAMTPYYDNGNFTVAFPQIANRNILGEVLRDNKCTQLRCAETEKYAHVTFFLNDQLNEPFEGEDRILVDSPKVATYDLQPEMSIFKVRDRLLEAIINKGYDVIITNFANCDMVGHTGVPRAIKKAVEAVDECVHDVVEATLAKGGICLLTADHGNADKIRLDDGSPMTSHTTNPVNFTVVGLDGCQLREEGGLQDIAPTILKLLNLKQPEEMTGQSLVL